jgi:hypothetical protein
MTMRMSMGLCAALAFAVGSTAVHAVKILDTTGEFYLTDTTNVNPETTSDSVTYATETVLKGEDNMQMVEDDDTVYYKIMRPHIFAAPAGIAASDSDTYLVTYRLEGMVFSGIADVIGDANTQLGSAISGGAAGDSQAVFRSSTALGKDAVIELSAPVAVSAEGGSITRTVLNRSLEGIPGIESSETHDVSGIIKFASALKETVTPTSPAPEAKAAAGFMNFGTDRGEAILVVSLGKIVLGVASPNLRNARADSNTVAGADISSLGGETGITAPVADDGSITNPVTFSGNFSFVKTVALGVGGCSGDLVEIRKSEGSGEDVMYLNETMPMDALTFMADADPEMNADDQGGSDDDDTPFHLCVEVDGETEIPKTAADNPFQVMAMYKGLVDTAGEVTAAHPPTGMARDLAMIDRDGASFNITYLTVNEAYNQRVIIVNRGSDTTYTFGSFQAAGDGMAEAGDMASGMLPTGQTVLRSNMIVKVTGGNVASATLSVVTDQSNISAAIQQRHLMEGTVDTVYLD